jgi:hypothetical protein
MNFKQWLTNQSPKTFNIVNSPTPGKVMLQVGFGGQVEGEIDNLTNADLQALQQLLNQHLPQPQANPYVPQPKANP